MLGCLHALAEGKVSFPPPKGFAIFFREGFNANDRSLHQDSRIQGRPCQHQHHLPHRYYLNPKCNDQQKVSPTDMKLRTENIDMTSLDMSIAVLSFVTTALRKGRQGPSVRAEYAPSTSIATSTWQPGQASPM